LTHVHELDFSFLIGVGPERWQCVKGHSTSYIACAGVVKDALVRYGAEASKVDVVHAFVPAITAQNREAGRRLLREELGLPNEALVVGAAGQVGWRKGADLLVQLAKRVGTMRAGEPIYFVWIGGGSAMAIGEAEHDVRMLGLEERVRFVGPRKNPLPYFAGFDLFVLPSREDPYPLVCLEAASVGVPIICFDRAGGMPEFVESDCGIVVPYLDVDRMAQELISLLEDPSRREAMGHRAMEKVRQRHDVNVAAPMILSIMEKLL
jgi:glycosyltransferase involved in cell wall biosynthesis